MAKRTAGVFAVTGQADWDVVNVAVRANGRHSTATIRIPDTAIPSTNSPDTVYVVTLDGTTVLKGRALVQTNEWGPSSEDVEYVITGGEWECDRTTLWGQMAPRALDNNVVHMTGLRCTFNEKGIPNKDSVATAPLAFNPDPNDPNTEPWTVDDMLTYIIERLNDATGETIIDAASVSWPKAATSALEIPDVNVQGLSPGEAITELLGRIGQSWRLSPKTGGLVDHDIRIFDKNTAPVSGAKTLYLPARGAALSVVTGNENKAVTYGRLGDDYSPIVTELTGITGPKIYEDVFTLVPGWTAADELAAFGAGDVKGKISNLIKLTNKETAQDAWDTYKDVGRLYILNETGREPNFAGSTVPFSFASLFGTSSYASRARPFLTRLVEVDSAGNKLPPKVTVEQPDSAATQDTDRDFPFDILDNIAGIRFRGTRFPLHRMRGIQDDDETSVWPTSVKIKAAIRSDEAYRYVKVATGADMTTLVEQTIDMSTKFVWEKADGGGAPTTTALDDWVDEKIQEFESKVAGMSGTIEIANTDFEVGDWITQIEGRVITVAGAILEIQYDGLQNQMSLTVGSERANVLYIPIKERPKQKMALTEPAGRPGGGKTAYP